MTTKEFIQYANDHPELCEKMSLCTAPEEAYALAVAEGLTDSYEVFKESMIEVRNTMEVADEDLENVSAGSTTTDTAASIVLSVITSSMVTTYMAAAI